LVELAAKTEADESLVELDNSEPLPEAK
jgi:hypothetical protein